VIETGPFDQSGQSAFGGIESDCRRRALAGDDMRTGSALGDELRRVEDYIQGMVLAF
jgi:hypothetical protein